MSQWSLLPTTPSGAPTPTADDVNTPDRIVPLVVESGAGNPHCAFQAVHAGTHGPSLGVDVGLPDLLVRRPDAQALDELPLLGGQLVLARKNEVGELVGLEVLDGRETDSV